MATGITRRPIAEKITPVEFSYRLTGTGWAEARIADDSAWVTLTASYLEDALGVLLEAVGVLLEGAVTARCSWEEEPGEYRWIFDRSDTEVDLRVLAFGDVYSRDPDEKGVLVFRTLQPLAVLSTAIADGAQSVLDEYGEEEYLRRWVDHPFPTAHLALIKERLAAA
jgi:hypothetical protein